MFLGDLLDKYRAKLGDHSLVIESFQTAVKELTGINIDSKQINYRQQKIYLKTSPIIRNEVFISKERIIIKTNQLLDRKAVVDIK